MVLVTPPRTSVIAVNGANFLTIAVRNCKLRQVQAENNTRNSAVYLYIVPPYEKPGSETGVEPIGAITLKDRQPPYRGSRNTIWSGDLNIPDKPNWFVEAELFGCIQADNLTMLVMFEE